MVNTMTLREEIIRKLIKDKGYADSLCESELSVEDIAKLVCHAPISLYEKCDLYKRLVEDNQDNNDELFLYGKYLSITEKVICDMKLPSDGMFLLVGYYFSQHEEQFECTPFKSFDKAVEYLQETFKESGEENVWYTLEKWLPKEGDSIGFYKASEFTFIGDKPCYYKNLRYLHNKTFRERNKMESGVENDFSLCSSGIDLNLFAPFKIGDVLYIDCRPFAPQTEVAVVRNDSPYDCCNPQCEYIDEKGKKKIGALKHSHIYKENVSFCISPLYNLKWNRKK